MEKFPPINTVRQQLPPHPNIGPHLIRRNLLMSPELQVYNPANIKNIAKLIALLHKHENGVPSYLKKIVVDRLLWAVTENDNDGVSRKYLGQPYWSKGALEMARKNISEDRSYAKDLRHEHAVPKKVLRKAFESIRMDDENSVLHVLRTMGHAVVVSKEEDGELNKKGLRSRLPRELPEKPTIKDIHARYHETEIEVVHIGQCDSPKNLKKAADKVLGTAGNVKGVKSPFGVPGT